MSEGRRALCPLGMVLVLPCGVAVPQGGLGAGWQHQECWNPGAEPTQARAGCLGKLGAATAREGGGDGGIRGEMEEMDTRVEEESRAGRHGGGISVETEMGVEEVGLGWKSGWMRWDEVMAGMGKGGDGNRIRWK